MAGAIGSWYQITFERGAGDFEWALYAAQDVLRGENPYDRELYVGQVAYPLTTALVAIPFAVLPLPPEIVAGLFLGLSSMLLAWGITAQGEPYWRLLIFCSFPFWQCIQFANWTILLFAGWYIPLLSFLSVAKPHAGLPILVERLSLTVIAICAAITGLAFLILPTWPQEWLSTLGPYTGGPALLVLPLGPLVLLALLRWRHAEARLLFWAALVPLRPIYDQLILFAVPTTARQLGLLVGLSWVYCLFFFLKLSRDQMMGVVILFFLPLTVIQILQWRQERRAAAAAASATNE
jgi:hypothetical protein